MQMIEIFYSKQIWSSKMKTILLLIGLLSSLNAFTISEPLLKMHATIVPKIYLMDYNCNQKSINKTITIAIVYEQSEYKSANLLQELILRKYKDGIKSYKVKTKLVKYDKVKHTNANLFYLFPSSKMKISTVVNKAQDEHALTFAYSKEDLKYGVMISLDVSKNVKPLLNLQAMKQNNISIRPVLIDISTIYDNKKQNLLNSLTTDQKTTYIALGDLYAY